MRSTGVAVTQPNVPASADSMENSIKALIGINSTSHQAGSTNTSSSAPASVPVQSHQNGLSELFGMMASHTIPSVSQNYTQVDQLQQAGQYPSYSAFSGSSTASVLPYTPINSQSQTFGFPSSDYGAFRPSTMPTSTPAPANPAVGPTPISSVEPSVRTASLLELLATGSSTTATPVNIPAPTSSFMQSLGSVTSSSLLAGLLNLPPPPKPFKSKSEGLSSSSLESLQIKKISERDDDDDDENLSQRRPPPPPEPSPGVMTQPLRPYIPPAVSISSPVSASPSSARSHFNDALSSTTVSHSTPLNTSTSSYHDTPSPGSVDAYPRSVTDLPPTVPSSGRTKRQSDTSKLSNIISPTSSSAGRPPSRAESVSSATSSTATRRPSKPLPVPPFSPPPFKPFPPNPLQIVA
ncbi:hypothetical protein BC829DRAFT_229407 [Chytridium lagenaria]|nr:hypothetical protein BC829DRAFT_229407 [Chytridium lagenaria]